MGGGCRWPVRGPMEPTIPPSSPEADQSIAPKYAEPIGRVTVMAAADRTPAGTAPAALRTRTTSPFHDLAPLLVEGRSLMVPTRFAPDRDALRQHRETIFRDR